MTKKERIRQAITLHNSNEFTVKEIHAKVAQFGVSQHHLATFISKQVAAGNYRKLRHVRSGKQHHAIYTKAKIDKSKQLKQQPLPIPDNLPLDVIGEAIFATFKLLKNQVFQAEAQIEKLRVECTFLRKEARDLQKRMKDREEELISIREALRAQTGKTFPMSEVARIIRNGRIVVQ